MALTQQASRAEIMTTKSVWTGGRSQIPLTSSTGVRVGVGTDPDDGQKVPGRQVHREGFFLGTSVTYSGNFLLLSPLIQTKKKFSFKGGTCGESLTSHILFCCIPVQDTV